MKSFTLASAGYDLLARITAACFTWATGIEAEIITPEGDPFEAKLQLPAEEQYWCVDADLLFRKKVELPAVPEDTFAAAPAQVFDRNVRDVVDAYGLRWPLVNTGLFCASKAHRDVMARALEHLRNPRATSHVQEEMFLNVALQELGTPVQLLPQQLNQQRIQNAYATTLHFCGERGPEAKLAAVMHHLDRRGPTELLEHLTSIGVVDFAATVRERRRRWPGRWAQAEVSAAR